LPITIKPEAPITAVQKIGRMKRALKKSDELALHDGVGKMRASKHVAHL
jgi:hypothetical protein